MLEHLRLTVPPDLVDEVLSLLTGHDCITNVVRHEGVCLVPAGDLLECDVARESTSDVLDDLHRLGLTKQGGVLVMTPDSTPFAEAERIAALAPGDPDDAVIWPEVVERAEGAARLTMTYLAFMVLAVVLAAIAVVTDSSILVIGAMVVGPEFGAVGALAVGVVLGKWTLARRAGLLLAGGFAFAIVVVTALSFLASWGGLVDVGMLRAARPQTGFIWRPDAWSFIVAVVAGAAGVLAMTTDRANAMVGVFISVTTVPAAGNLALALALHDGAEVLGSAQQLGVNLLGMLLAGCTVVLVQRLVWDRLLELSEQWFHRSSRSGFSSRLRDLAP